MDNLFRFIYRYHVLLIYLIIVFVSFIFINNTSYFQRSIIMTKADAVKSVYFNTVKDWTDYLHLKRENSRLSDENSQLLNKLDKLSLLDSANYYLVTDSLKHASYKYLPSKIIYNTLNKRNNYLIINSGYNQGVEVDMGVIAPDGIIGTVERVSANYSTIMSVLSSKREFHVKLKKTGHTSPLSWDGGSYRYAHLNEIMLHVPVAIGDTIITSGRGEVFPEGIMVGTVKSTEALKGTFLKVKVLLSTDFQSANYVNVIAFQNKKEIEDHISNANK